MNAKAQTIHQPKPPQTLMSARSGFLQRKCACGSTANLSGECKECNRKHLTVQRRSAGQTEPRGVPPIVGDVLRSSGQPLDTTTRAQMEAQFGHDFSQVRIHTDARAARSARAVNAVAYTVGHDIVFEAGQYQPATTTGQKLLAHELAHTIQQSTGGAHGVAARSSVSRPDDPAEQEADRAAEAVVAGRSATNLSGVNVHVARKRKPTGTIEKLKAAGFTNWDYIVYDDEILLRFWDPGPKGQPATEIGTIPWLTHNPGNQTVNPNISPDPGAAIPAHCKDPAKDKVSEDSLQAFPLKQGAVTIYNCRYAVYKSFFDGMNAILPYLRKSAEKNPNKTVEQALFDFKGLEKKEKEALDKNRAEREAKKAAGEEPPPLMVDPRQKYVDDIKAGAIRFLQSLLTPTEAGDPAELKKVQKRVTDLMKKKILDVTKMDDDIMLALLGLMKNEGLLAAPGLRYTCDGFDDELNSTYQYDGKQKRLMEAARASTEVNAELRAALGCP